MAIFCFSVVLGREFTLCFQKSSNPNQGAAYYTMLNQLSKAGMSAKVLFPDLQGVCESLKFSWLEASTDLEPSQDEP